MAKTSSVNKNKRREKLAKQFAAKRARLKAMAVDDKLSPEDRFEARIKLAELPRNSSPTRIRNRCEITGRPRAVYRKFKLSRLALQHVENVRPQPRRRHGHAVEARRLAVADAGQQIADGICHRHGSGVSRYQLDFTTPGRAPSEAS